MDEKQRNKSLRKTFPFLEKQANEISKIPIKESNNLVKLLELFFKKYFQSSRKT